MPHKANSIICCHLPHFKEDNVKSWEQCGPLMFLSTSLSLSLSLSLTSSDGETPVMAAL